MTLIQRPPRLLATIVALVFGVLGVAATASAEDGLVLEGALSQGGLVIGSAEPGSAAFLDDRRLKISPEGRFVFGFGRDHGATARLKIVAPDGAEEIRDLAVAPQAYEIEKIDGLPPRTVTIPPEQQQRRTKERRMVGEARSHDSDEMSWADGFRLPAEGRISGRYGSQRILNGEPRTPHFGLDVAAPVGTPVVAPAAGTIVLAQPDFLLEGGLIIIDHGFSIYSSLMHLSKVSVDVGEHVSKGQVIGAIGATGRASGPHVDWRINWGNVRLDPMLALTSGAGD